MSHTQVFAMGNIYNIKSSKTQPHVVMTLTLSTITAPSVLGQGCLINVPRKYSIRGMWQLRNPHLFLVFLQNRQ